MHICITLCTHAQTRAPLTQHYINQYSLTIIIVVNAIGIPCTHVQFTLCSNHYMLRPEDGQAQPKHVVFLCNWQFLYLVFDWLINIRNCFGLAESPRLMRFRFACFFPGINSHRSKWPSVLYLVLRYHIENTGSCCHCDQFSAINLAMWITTIIAVRELIAWTIFCWLSSHENIPFLWTSVRLSEESATDHMIFLGKGKSSLYRDRTNHQTLHCATASHSTGPHLCEWPVNGTKYLSMFGSWLITEFASWMSSLQCGLFSNIRASS
jgi:hypothetical protein